MKVVSVTYYSMNTFTPNRS